MYITFTYILLVSKICLLLLKTPVAIIKRNTGIPLADIISLTPLTRINIIYVTVTVTHGEGSVAVSEAIECDAGFFSYIEEA